MTRVRTVPDLFEWRARAARGAGFGGMFCARPGQVALADRVFAPGEREREWVRHVVQAFEAAGDRAGAVAVDGAMVGRPFPPRALSVAGAS